VHYGISSNEKLEIFKSLAPQEKSGNWTTGSLSLLLPFHKPTISSLGWWIATSFSVKEECDEPYRRDLLLQVAMRALDFNVKEEARCEVACRASCQQWLQWI
jgi:hypothetical protein